MTKIWPRCVCQSLGSYRFEPLLLLFLGNEPRNLIQFIKYGISGCFSPHITVFHESVYCSPSQDWFVKFFHLPVEQLCHAFAQLHAQQCDGFF